MLEHRTRIAVTAGLAAAALAVAAFAGDGGVAAKPKRKPAQVNVVQSVPLEFSSATSPLPVTVAPTTHVGQPVGDLVVLQMIQPTTSPIFVRCNDDGTRDTAEFVVPAGRKLVVTDVDWLATWGTAASLLTLRLFVENRTTSSNRCLVFLSVNATTNTSWGGGTSPEIWGSTGPRTGFVVGEDGRVVADLQRPETGVSAGTTLAPFPDTRATILLRGYLTSP